MQFKTKLGLVDIPNEEVLSAARAVNDDTLTICVARDMIAKLKEENTSLTARVRLLETERGVRPWPTLDARLDNALTTREAAACQLQTMIPISPLAEGILQRSKSKTT